MSNRTFRVQAIIVANNRPDYLNTVTAAFRKYHPHIPCIVINDEHHAGMAANVNAAWSWAYGSGMPWILHLEDDMELVTPLPIRRAEQILASQPHLANMVFKRQPWSGREHDLGDVIAATCETSNNWHEEKDYTVHDRIFSLNPCLIPRRVIARGWPPGNEAEMTDKLRADGYQFAFYGHAGDPPLIRHIGEQRGPQWRL